jgi:dTDP-4-dehydrorhamnose reductase
MSGERSSTPPLELWAGPECTVNRVGDRYLDQLARSGHDRRLDDLDRIAELGVRAVRYPVLWERAARDDHWAWADERLARIRGLGMKPIVGLVHHGSGPPDTSLVADDFPERLAAYAGAVAARYPWVDAYTPVNEPLTTARFSGLYGLWYPHGRDDRTFVRALIQQCRGTVLAMRAIRAVQPHARLVQTEDLAHVRSTRRLQYQADFENERRWLSFDLIAGRVDRSHPMFGWLRSCETPESELEWFRRSPCPADLLGLNYYATSERYLDDDLDAWPERAPGGNGRHRYVDVEAVRACGMVGLEELLHQTWARHQTPIAITEAHLGCSREEQVRWLVEIWEAAASAARAGIPVRAVTVWAMFGSYDWNTLVTRESGHYEPGAFDVRGSTPRPTAIAAVMRDLGAGRRPSHPVLDGDGWWRRAARREEAA